MAVTTVFVVVVINLQASRVEVQVAWDVVSLQRGEALSALLPAW